MIRKAVRMSDVAERFNVSNVTVSKALADKEGVSDELREKIKAAAVEMGYRYNINAKGMKDGLSYNVGVIVAERFINPPKSSNTAQPFYWEMYRNVLESLRDQSYYGIIEIIKSGAEELLELPELVMDNKVDGIIIMGQMSQSYVNNLRKTGVPLVFLDFYMQGAKAPTVLSDNFYGAYMLTNYLFDNGHTNIGFVGTVNATSSIQDRFLGYYKSLLEHKIEKRGDWIIDDRSEDGTFIDFTMPKDMPTALVCNCDQAAYRMIQTLTDMGYNVPEDISVVGFDNYIFATLCKPALTTIDVDMKKMAAAAANAMFSKIKNKKYVNERIMISGNLIIRDSVKNIAAD